MSNSGLEPTQLPDEQSGPIKVNEWVRSGDPDVAGIEARYTDTNYVEVRHSGKPEVVITTNPEEWKTFTDGVKNGEYDYRNDPADLFPMPVDLENK